MSARQERIARKARQRAGTEHYYKTPKVPTTTYESRTRSVLGHGHFDTRGFDIGRRVLKWMEQTHVVKFAPRNGKRGA